MRLRWERRIRKRLRGEVGRAVAGRERRGESLEEALCGVLTDGSFSQWDRAEAGRLMSIGVDGRAVRELVAQFFRQEAKDELYMTALALEALDDARAVPALIRALLEDANAHRRHAAARALGWISRPGRGAARALALCLADPGQPQAAREEAAESLAYVGSAETIDVLIGALSDGDVRIRFWAVWGWGGSCRGEARAVRALEGVLGDGEVPPGTWWSVGREALAMLGGLRFAGNPYRGLLAEAARRVLGDAGAGEEERRWAGLYGDVG